MRVLPSTLWWHIGYGALDNLKQSLLYTLTNTFIMVVDCNCQCLLRTFLTYNVLTELFVNLLRCWHLACLQAWFRNGSLLLLDDLPTQIDTLIADIDTTRSCY